MTAHEINKVLLGGKPVVAICLIKGVEMQVRIIQARCKASIVQGKILGTGRWADLKSDSAWEAK